jgi:hypothetical protein
MQDEVSRRIFIYRLRFSLEKYFISPLKHPAIPLPDEKHLKANIIEYLTMVSESFDSEINKRICNDRPLLALHNLINNYCNTQRIIIFGAGNFGKCTKDFLEARNIKTDLFCDSKKGGTDFCGIRVIPAELLDASKSDYIIIAIGTTSARKDIYNFLINHGYSQQNISMCYATFDQYFEYPFLKQIDSETYVDVGCCDGTTILDYKNFCRGKYKNIIGLEADISNYKKTCDLIDKEKIINALILQKGAWSRNTILNFSGTGNETAKITDISPQFGGGFLLINLMMF